MGTGKNIFRGRQREGFTLIELVIVLFLIGIMSGIAGLYIGRDTGSLELKTFTKEISSLMRYARNHAVSEKKVYCFVIDREERKLRLYSEDPDYTNVILLNEKEIPGEIDIDLAERERDEAAFVEFFPGGNTSGGVLEISNVSGTRYFLIVNRITGKLKVEKEE